MKWSDTCTTLSPQGTMTLPHNILVCTDLSDASDAALREAFRWSAWCDAVVHALYVEQTPFDPAAAEEPVPAQGELAQKAYEDLQRALKVAGGDDVRLGELWIRLGDPRRTILASAAQLSADLIVVASHGRTGVRRLFLGSVAESIVRDARSSVLVARTPTPGRKPATTRGPDGAPARSWLVAADLRPPSEVMLASALEYAQAAQAEAHVLHVYAPLLGPSMEAYAKLSPHDDLHRRVLRQLELLTEPQRATHALGKCIAAAGDPRLAIPRAAEEFGCELIVLGWNAPSFSRLLLGRVHRTVLRQAPCSVLVVKEASQ